MRLLWKAVRAVTVETLGIVAVVWILFTGAGLTVADKPTEHRVDVGQAFAWAQATAGDWADGLRPGLEKRDREQYVEDRLDHYTEIYRQAAGEYIERAAKELAREVTVRRGQDASASAGDFLGSL